MSEVWRCRSLRRVLSLAVIAAVFSIASGAGAVDAPLKEDRIRFIVHDLVAAQLSAEDLGGYLDAVHGYFHGSQNTSIDVPTCTDIGTVTEGGPQPYLYTSSGELANELAIIDTEAELFDVLNWAETQGDRVGVFVQDIRWCGAVAPNTIGCAPVPGKVFVVSLTATQNVRGMVIGHERGHNAGLSHRADDSCALMFASALSTHGCLNQAEAKALYNKANISTGDTCECINVQFQGPNQTWSLNPQGTACDDESVCSTTSTCDVGLCEGATLIDCSDADPCTDDNCDAVTGCENPPSPEFTTCFDGDVCNGFELCQSGVCTAGTPQICDDQLYCNGLETCDPISGCESGTPPELEDGILCTLDACDEPSDSIVHTPDDASCANGDFCDGDEACNALVGCVSGTPPPLDDGVACTLDTCDEQADSIVHTPDDASCANGDFCDGDESCNALIGCESGDPPLVDDGVVCTLDTCNEQTDSIENIPDDASCANGIFCDGDESCNALSGCEAGTPPLLDDGVDCTDDSCNEFSNLVAHIPKPTLCDDGDFCTAESCDEILGCFNDPIPDCVYPEVPAVSIGGHLMLLGLLSLLGMTALARTQRVVRADVRR